ncbi:MAG: helix-turn-helix domain-containing protein [Candidatus Korobacteraceae bacterium]|jgi:transcriptional regulator with XRE-family HTH domain
MQNVCQCGGQVTAFRGDYLFLESGLDNVTLRGVKLLRCRKCGSLTPVLTKINELMRVIASAVVLKPSALTGKEIRYLRKYIGLTGEQFGKKLGLTKEHVSRLETEKHSVGEQTERLIRYLAISTDPVLQGMIGQLFERLDNIKAEPQPDRIEVNLATGSFRYAAA